MKSENSRGKTIDIFPKEKSERFSKETLYAASIFQQLSPDTKKEILKFLRKIQK